MGKRHWIAAALLGGTALMGTTAQATTSVYVHVGPYGYNHNAYGYGYYPERHWNAYRSSARYWRSPDRDRDGIPDRRDRDLDNDGRANRYDRDMDGDGVSNWRDRAPTNRYRY